MILHSIIAVKDRLVDVERRLDVERRRREPYPAVVASLTQEAAELRQQIWSIRRGRYDRMEAGDDR